jgi:hypothetical protein
MGVAPGGSGPYGPGIPPYGGRPGGGDGGGIGVAVGAPGVAAGFESALSRPRVSTATTATL